MAERTRSWVVLVLVGLALFLPLSRRISGAGGPGVGHLPPPVAVTAVAFAVAPPQAELPPEAEVIPSEEAGGGEGDEETRGGSPPAGRPRARARAARRPSTRARVQSMERSPPRASAPMRAWWRPFPCLRSASRD